MHMKPLKVRTSLKPGIKNDTILDRAHIRRRTEMSKAIEVNRDCPMNVAFNVLDGKYKLKILWHLSKGTIRFNELQRAIGDVTQKTLTMQLR